MAQKPINKTVLDRLQRNEAESCRGLKRSVRRWLKVGRPMMEDLEAWATRHDADETKLKQART